METPVRVFVWTHVFTVAEYKPWSGVAGSAGSSGFDLGRSCQSVFLVAVPLYVPAGIV